jgi:hypothetical protein
MQRVVITALIVLAVATAVFTPSAAAVPAPPDVAPYAGCSDWSWSPTSTDDGWWVFRCLWEDSVYPTESWAENDYYWDAASSQVGWYATYAYDWGWYYRCVIPPGGAGACEA